MLVCPTRALLLIAPVSLCACAHSGPNQATVPASSTVTSEDIERNAPGRPVEEALMGRVSGVVVERTPGGGVAVRIRGAASFMSSTRPLYVLDGTPFEPGPNGFLAGLNPRDIESIRVLKDAAETAIYGIRGANGVIVITTKRPGK